MNKSLVTICWSCTVEVELPEGVGLEELNEYYPHDGPNQVLSASIIKEAADNINWYDGTITDVEQLP